MTSEQEFTVERGGIPGRGGAGGVDNGNSTCSDLRAGAALVRGRGDAGIPIHRVGGSFVGRERCGKKDCGVCEKPFGH